MMNSLLTLQRQIESLRTCGICHGFCRNPRSIECLHSFCLECLKRLLEENAETNSIFCPICNVKINGTSQSNSSYLESLPYDSVFRNDNALSEFENHGNVNCKKHPDFTCDFYYSDRLELACIVCKNQRRENCEILTDYAAVKIRDKRHELLKTSISKTKQELVEVLDGEKTMERQALEKNDKTMLGVMKYFMDLRTQVNEYLAKHEKEVLCKLKTFTGNEMSKLADLSKSCLSLLQSMENKFGFLNKPFSKADRISALYTYCGFGVFESHINDFASRKEAIKQSVQNDTEIRFIINTDMEDMLSGGDLIDIEIINPRTRTGRVESSVDDEASSEATAASITATREQIDTPSTDNSAAESRSSTTNGGITITVSPPDDDPFDEPPPPPYPGTPADVTPEQDQMMDSEFASATTHPTEVRSDSPIPSAPSFSELYTAPIVPRGLTTGIQQEPATPSDVENVDRKVVIKALKKFRISVNHPCETAIPNLVDLCWITDDTLVALDKKNRCFKFFRYTGSSLSVHYLSQAFEPYGCTVYQIGNDLAVYLAVTYPKERTITVYTIDQNYQLLFEFEKITSKGYTRITFSENEKKFICASTSPFSLPAVDILDPEGNLLSSFHGTSRVPFGYPRAIRVNKEGTIAISDYKTSRVMFMDMNGIHKSVFDGSNTRNLNDPQGIGVHEDLRLFFVVDTKMNRIYCVDYDGNIHETIRQTSLMEQTPRFIDFSPSLTPKLAVGHGNGYISVYQCSGTNSFEFP